MRKLFLLPCMAAALPLLGGELLKNGGFEEKTIYPWESYPLQSKIAVDAPASGKQFLRMQAQQGQPQQVSQRGLSVKGGNAYSIRLQARAMNGAKAFQAVAVFSDADGKNMGSQLLFRRVPGAQWAVYQGAFLAPKGAVRVQMILQMDAAQGCVDIDDVSLTDNGPVAGAFGEVQITLAGKKLLLKTPSYTLSLDLERNATIDRMEADGSSRLEDVYMTLNNEKNSDRYASRVLSLLKAEKTDDGAIVTVEVTLPDMKVTRRIETFNGSPYFKLTYESEMTREVKAPRLFVSVMLPHHFRIVTWMIGKDFRSRKWTKAEWFGLIRPENPRCITFLQEDGTKGLGIAGADESLWKSLPPSMVASARKNGGFSVEFLLSAKKDLRPGDKKALELFLYPAAGDAQSAKTAIELGAGRQ